MSLPSIIGIAIGQLTGVVVGYVVYQATNNIFMALITTALVSRIMRRAGLQCHTCRPFWRRKNCARNGMILMLMEGFVLARGSRGAAVVQFYCDSNQCHSNERKSEGSLCTADDLPKVIHNCFARFVKNTDKYNITIPRKSEPVKITGQSGF